MQTQVNRALRVPSDAELKAQEELFDVARRIQRLRAEIRQREEHESRYLTMLRAQLDEAVTRYRALIDQQVKAAAGVRS